MSLAAAVNMLSARLAEIAPAAAPIRLEPVRRHGPRGMKRTLRVPTPTPDQAGTRAFRCSRFWRC